MTFLVITFLASLLIATIIVRSGSRHARLSADHDMSGPQKFHSRPVPRIGGIAVFAALLAGVVSITVLQSANARLSWMLILCALPAFAFGLLEDLVKNVSPRRRLFFTAVSSLLAIWLLGGVIVRTTIPGIDTLVTWTPFAIALTILAVTGVANAINIIDGFNGLASMCVLLMVLALAYVAFQVGDTWVFSFALIVAGSILGFFVLNFPAGLIFLGDGGAYLLGFLLAELSLLLLHRNPQVSPMFALLLCSYPIFETVFTMYRRKFVRGTAASAPDGIHLHTLIHRRVVRWLVGVSEDRRRTARNSMTSPYLWLVCLFAVVPAVLWWDNTTLLSLSLLAFMVGYVFLYRSIVRFRTPKWLLVRR